MNILPSVFAENIIVTADTPTPAKQAHEISFKPAFLSAHRTTPYEQESRPTQLPSLLLMCSPTSIPQEFSLHRTFMGHPRPTPPWTRLSGHAHPPTTSDRPHGSLLSSRTLPALPAPDVCCADPSACGIFHTHLSVLKSDLAPASR